MAMARGVQTYAVRRQISHLQKKLGAANSDELVQRAITLGLVNTEAILTPRQQEALELYAAGARAEQLAQALGVLVRSTQRLLDASRARLDVPSVDDAVAVAMTLGLIDRDRGVAELAQVEQARQAAKEKRTRAAEEQGRQAANEKRKRAAELLAGRYELGELLGRGGMAEVRRAVDVRIGRSVAVKQLRANLAIDPTFQARFRREAQSAAALNHPTIVAVYDTGEEIDPLSGVSRPYVVMELIEGPTLRDVLREGRKILPERALELTQGVLEALSYSHKAGIVHRDIKPANVMITPNGGVKVMDFGIARAVADTSATMTQTAAVIGTAQYLSPEQARGETVDARSDLYSAGCLLYELLAGRPPFVGDSPVNVAYQHVREAAVAPSQLDPELTPEIDAVVLKALAKDPDDRYQSAGAMKADISRVLSGEQTWREAEERVRQPTDERGRRAEEDAADLARLVEQGSSAARDQGKATYKPFVPLRLQWALFVGFLVVVVILILTAI
jgi:DNA-binding CsgD family transcriptional regulator